MALFDYLATEIGLDWQDGLITRREALRRLGLMGLSAGAAASVLAACAGGEGSASPASTGGTATTAAPPASTAPSTTGAATSAAAPATDPADAAAAPVTAAPVSFAGPAGTLFGYFAGAPTPKGAVLIVHENRGLTPHFKELPGRFAGVGYSALSLDLLSRSGGTDTIADEGARSAEFAKLAPEDLVADMRSGLDELGKRTPGAKLGAIGFCFGGAQVWSLLAAGEPRLAAAAPFYGPGPSDADFRGSRAAVLGVYAENDARVNASKDAIEAALIAAGLVHQLRVFPGADHAFFNDTGSRYNPDQAAAAWTAVLDWFETHLA
jgi:carboxymethylenebutenolidase